MAFRHLDEKKNPQRCSQVDGTISEVLSGESFRDLERDQRVLGTFHLGGPGLGPCPGVSIHSRAVIAFPTSLILHVLVSTTSTVYYETEGFQHSGAGC